MLNWSHMLHVFEQETPRFAVNQSNAYQALTFGWLVGGALEKATGRGLSDLMQTYLVKPLQLDGAFFGVPSSELDRVARLIPQKRSTEQNPQDAKTKKVKAHKPSLADKLVTWTGQNPQDFQDAMILSLIHI